MAASFNLTAQINLRGPTDLKPVVSKIKRELSGITTNVRINIDNKSAKSVDIVTKRLGAMNAAIVQARNNTISLNDALRTLSASLSTIQNTGSASATSVNKVASASKSASQSIKEARTEMEIFGRQAFLAVKRFAAYTTATAGIFALTNVVTSGFKAFIAFDKELVKLQQVTGKGALGIKSLEKQITSLATTLGVSSESLVAVASTLAQAGLSAEETRIALVALAKTELAPSFDNLTDTTEGAIAALRQFELQAGDLESALGSINAVAAAFAVESKDIISAIQRTGGVFASASKGVSEGVDALNEFVAIFTSVRQTTRESAETIATGLRTIFTRIQRSSTIELLKQYGVELRDLEGKFVGPFEAVRRLSDALNQLDPRSASFAKIVEELGGFRQIGKVIPLIQQFAVAQQALGVAQKGQSSLTDAQIKAQQSLANQIAKVREQFLALIRDIGQSTVFKGFFTIVTRLAGGLISLAGAFKPILPILAVFASIKGVSAIGQFATGFFGGFKKGGGAGSAGQNLGQTITGSKDKERAEATSRAADAIRLNTDALKGLTSAVTSLENTIKSRGPATLNSGGKVMAFARGGVVPGSGNRDTVPAMLMPGEFVIRKKAVEKLGAGNLHKMNKYAYGGKVKDLARIYPSITRTENYEEFKNQTVNDKSDFIPVVPTTDERIAFQNQTGKNYEKFEDLVGKKYRLGSPAQGYKYLDYPQKRAEAKFMQLGQNYKDNDNKGNNPETIAAKNFLYENSLYNAPGNQKNSKVKTLTTAELDNKPARVYYPENTSDFFRSIRSSVLAKERFPSSAYASGGLVQKFANGGKALGARSKFKELTQEEILQLSTKDLIAYGKALAQDIFSTGGAGMAVANEFIEVPPERIIPELDPYLSTYLGKRGFWREKISPFGQAIVQKVGDTSKAGRQNALQAQIAKQADEVAAREQNWTAIRAGSEIDKYLQSTLEEPALSDYKTVRGGGSLGKAFHNTRLRQAVNKALEGYDDFDYSSENIGKLITNMANKRFFAGGSVSRFEVGGVVGSVGKISQDILDRIKALGGRTGIVDLAADEAAKAVEQTGIPASKLFKSNVLGAMVDGAKFAPYLEPVLKAAEAAKRNKETSARQQLENNMKAAAGGAYQFGLVSLFGPNGQLGYSDVSNARELEGKDGQKFLTQIIKKSLPERYAKAIEQMQQDIAGVPVRGAEAFQYTDIFGTGGPIALDFDDTLVKDADIPGKKFQDYNDLNKVKEALGSAKLTLLGKELAKRLIDYPQLMDSIRVLTARPQSNAPLLASKLSSLGLPIPQSKITGVSGGLNKVENLSELETLIDDNLENIQAILGAGKKGYLYSEPELVDRANASSRKSMSGMEGYALEEIVRSFGVAVSSDDADPNRPIDYPKGLGPRAANLWGIKSTLPTDTKRTNDSSALSRMWSEAQRYFVEKFAVGGKVGDSNFEKVKDEILKKYPQINFRISKRKRGFGYNILGGLKQEGDNVGNYADFQQASNLTQLAELADRMANDLQYKFGPNIDPSLLKKTQKFAQGGLAEAKDYGKISISEDGTQISVGYLKNNTRSGYASAYKMRDYLYYVGLSKATKGYGPRLYDVLMEAVTEKGAMLTSDRSFVSDDAKKVWEYYFKNRADVKKTPLKPADWTGNPSLIDPKLYGKEETWPPSTDPAWILQSGYSKPPSLLNDPNIITRYAKGGSAEDTVPALLTPGEFVINRKAAKRIGYSKLNKLNQADKLGVEGYNRGGIVGGIQTFADGGTVSDLIIQLKEERESKTQELDELKEQAKSATGSARILIESKIKDTEKELNNLDLSISAAVDQFESLSNTIDTASRASEKRATDLSKAQADLVNRVREEAKKAGIDFDKLSESDKEKVIGAARSNTLDLGGKKIDFSKENKAIDRAQNRLDKANDIKQRAERKRESKFGSATSVADVRSMSLTPQERKQQRESDTAYLDYKARKENVSAESFRYGLAQKLGKTSYETQEMYGGRKEEMKQELVMKQRSLAGVGTTIQELTAKGSKRSAAEETQLADAQSRLAAEAEKIANDMKSLNPTLDMEMVTKASREVAAALASGDIATAQAKLVEALGDAPDDVNAMRIAMQKLAEETGISVDVLEREFGSGKGAKLIKQQQFVQSREGQRFGALAELAPRLTQSLSQTKFGKALGAGADFISGKGGRLSKLFAGAGGITGIGGGIAAGAEGLRQFLPTSMTKDPGVAGALGGLSGAGTGAAMGAQLGAFAGPIGALIGGIGGAIIGGIDGWFSSKNQAVLTNALDNLATTSGNLDNAFKKLDMEASDINFANAQKEFGNVLASEKNITDIAFGPRSTLLGSATSSTAMGSAATGAAIGAAVGSFIPVLGTAIGAAVGAGVGYVSGAYMDYRSKPSAAERKEAFETFTQQSSKDLESASRLSEISLNKKSVAELEQSIKDLKNGMLSASPTVQTYAESIMQSTGASREVAQQQAEEIALKQAYVVAMKQRGQEEKALQELEKNGDKLTEEMSKTAEEYIINQGLIINRNKLLSKTAREVAIASENLYAVYKKIAAYTQKISDGISDVFDQIQNRVNALTGNATIANVDRSGSERVLGNISAYSQDEVNAATNEIANLLGNTPEIRQTANQANAAKFLQEKLPNILRNNPNIKADDQIFTDVKKTLEETFGLDDNTINSIFTEIENSLNKDGADAESIAQEISSGNIGKISETAQKAVETFLNTSKLYNDGLQKTIDLQNQYNQVLAKAKEYQLRANDIQLNRSANLARSMGRDVSLNEMNKPFDQRIISLTGGIVPGGTTDSDKIAQAIQQREKENQQLNERNKQILPNSDEYIRNQEAIRKNNQAINEGTQAIEELANSTSKADNALSKIQQRVEQGKAFGSLLSDITNMNPEQSMGYMQEMQAFQIGNAALQNNVVDVFADQQFNRLFEAGFGRLRGILGANQSADMLRQYRLSQLQAAGINPDAETGLTKEDGTKITIRDLIDAEAGDLNKKDPLVQAYEKAVDDQIEANNNLADLTKKAAETIRSGLQQVFQELKEKLPQAVKEGLAGAGAGVAPARAAAGGMVDNHKPVSASQLVNFEPKGQDKYPFMLAKGEAVINAATTKKNPGIIGALLNNEVIEPGYAADGTVVGGASSMQDRVAALHQALKNPDLLPAKNRQNPESGIWPILQEIIPLLKTYDSKLSEELAMLTAGDIAIMSTPAIQSLIAEIDRAITKAPNVVNSLTATAEQQQQPTTIPQSPFDPGWLLMRENILPEEPPVLPITPEPQTDNRVVIPTSLQQPLTPAQKRKAELDRRAAQYTSRQQAKKEAFLQANPGIARKQEKEAEAKQNIPLGPRRDARDEAAAIRDSNRRRGEALLAKYGDTYDSSDYDETLLSANERKLLEDARQQKINSARSQDRANFDNKLKQERAARATAQAEADAKAAEESKISARKWVEQQRSAREQEVAETKARIEERGKREDEIRAQKEKDRIAEVEAQTDARIKSRRLAEKQKEAADAANDELIVDQISQRIKIDPITGNIISGENPELIDAELAKLNEQKAQAIKKFEQWREEGIGDLGTEDGFNRAMKGTGILDEIRKLTLTKRGIDLARNNFNTKKQQEIEATAQEYDELKKLADSGKLAASQSSRYARLAIIRGIPSRDIAGGGTVTAERQLRDESIGYEARQQLEKLGMEEYQKQFREERRTSTFDKVVEELTAFDPTGITTFGLSMLDPTNIAGGIGLGAAASTGVSLATAATSAALGYNAGDMDAVQQAAFTVGAMGGSNLAGRGVARIFRLGPQPKPKPIIKPKPKRQTSSVVRGTKVQFPDEIKITDNPNAVGILEEIEEMQANRILQELEQQNVSTTPVVDTAPKPSAAMPEIPSSEFKEVKEATRPVVSAGAKPVSATGRPGKPVSATGRPGKPVSATGRSTQSSSKDPDMPVIPSYSISVEEIAELLGPFSELLPRNRIITRTKGYSKGGKVGWHNGIPMPGLNNGDDTLATLKRGEGVVNAASYAKYGTLVDAINRSKGGKLNVPGFANGTENSSSTSNYTTMNNTGPTGFQINISAESQRIMNTFVTDLNSFANNFNTYIDKLSKINIPNKIEMVGRHTVQVQVDGAAAFDAIEEGMRSLINTEIGKKMNMLWVQSDGKLGESPASASGGNTRSGE